MCNSLGEWKNLKYEILLVIFESFIDLISVSVIKNLVFIRASVVWSTELLTIFINFFQKNNIFTFGY